MRGVIFFIDMGAKIIEKDVVTFSARLLVVLTYVSFGSYFLVSYIDVCEREEWVGIYLLLSFFVAMFSFTGSFLASIIMLVAKHYSTRLGLENIGALALLVVGYICISSITSPQLIRYCG